VLAPTPEGRLVPPNDPSSLLPLFDQAVSERTHSDGAGSAKLARSLKAKGLFLKAIGNPAAAVAPLRSAAEIDRGNRDADLFAVQEALGQALEMAGNRREAFEAFQQAA